MIEKKNRWWALWESLTIEHKPRRKYPRMSERTFASFERRWHLTLPESYKDFARLFGPGMLGQQLEIAAPGFKYGGNKDLDELNDPDQGVLRSLYVGFPCKDPRHLCRILYFAVSVGDDYFGWDPWEVTEAKESEYRIYVSARPPFEKLHVLKFAETFEELIQATGNSGGKARGVFKEQPTQKEFEPYKYW